MAEGHGARAPILVLGVGNPLLGDDGVGIHLLEKTVKQAGTPDERVEFLEGGTQGLALLGAVAGRDTLILLDAASLATEPGTVSVRRNEQVLELGARSSTAHEGNVAELLTASLLLGELPKHTVLIGVEPAAVNTGVELSSKVRNALQEAVAAAQSEIERALGRLAR